MMSYNFYIAGSKNKTVVIDLTKVSGGSDLFVKQCNRNLIDSCYISKDEIKPIYADNSIVSPMNDTMN
jgi:hypothetical protein